MVTHQLPFADRVITKPQHELTQPLKLILCRHCITMTSLYQFLLNLWYKNIPAMAAEKATLEILLEEFSVVQEMGLYMLIV